MDRKLAYIAKITAITPIDGADLIETVWIKGWPVVCKKGTHHIDEKVIYFEVDSYLPILPCYEFLRASSFKTIAGLGEGFRIRTVKLRKQLSQGLVLPLPEVLQCAEEGTDLTEVLGVKKYELPVSASLMGMMKGNFPSWLPKTDEERIQNLWSDSFYTEFSTLSFELTEKLGGSSMTIYVNGDDAGVCSRNVDLKLDQEGNTFIDTERKYQFIARLKQLIADNIIAPSIALQGELCGPGIQGNKYHLTEPTFFLFNVYYQNRYLTPTERKEILKVLNTTPGMTVLHVPVLDYNGKLLNNINELLLSAEGKSVIDPKTEREGIVFKSNELIDDERNKIASFKAISNKFLLTEK